MYKHVKSAFLICFSLLVGSLGWSATARELDRADIDQHLENSVSQNFKSAQATHTSDSLYRQAQQFVESQNLDAALLLMNRAVEIDPDEPTYWELLLAISQERGDVESAIAAVEELIRLVPDDKQNYLDHAFLLTYTENYEKALLVYDRYVERFGQEAQVATSRARILQVLERPNDAINELEAWLATDKNEVVAYVMLAELYAAEGRSSRALDVLEEGRNNLGAQPLFNVSRAEILRREGRIQEAFADLEKGFDSHMFDLDYKAGVLYRAISLDPSYEEGQILKLADQLARQYPVSVKSHAVRGDVYAQFGQFEEAKSSYETAVLLNPGVPQVWEQLISLSNYLGHTADAQKHAEKAASLFPNEPDLLFLVGHSYILAGNHEKARVHMEAALNSTANKETAYLSQIFGSLGSIYHNLDMHAASDVAYEEALAHDSLDVFSLNNYAYYLALRNEKLDRAIEMSSLAVRLQPDYATFEDTHAWVLFRLGKHKEALKWIRRALKNTEEPSATLLEHYGDILYKNGQVKDAVSQWKKAQKYAGFEEGSMPRLEEKIRSRSLID